MFWKTAALVATMMSATAAYAIEVELGGGWDGKKVPAGQQCALHGGNGSTPPMTVSGIPSGAKWIVFEFNDKDYAPLSSKGGHGTLAFPVKGASTKVPALPGMTEKLPEGAQMLKKARSSGAYASAGYLPPCSGGRGNRYTVDVKILDAAGKVLDTQRNVAIGRY